LSLFVLHIILCTRICSLKIVGTLDRQTVSKIISLIVISFHVEGLTYQQSAPLPRSSRFIESDNTSRNITHTSQTKVIASREPSSSDTYTRGVVRKAFAATIYHDLLKENNEAGWRSIPFAAGVGEPTVS
jgi:hypothetical protein